MSNIQNHKQYRHTKKEENRGSGQQETARIEKEKQRRHEKAEQFLGKKYNGAKILLKKRNENNSI